MRLKLFDPKKDAFDDIPDAFADVELPPDEKILTSPEFQKMVAAEVAKAVAAIKLPEPKEPMPQIIKEVRVEVPKKDTRELVEKSAFDAAMKRIGELEKELKETDQRARSPLYIPSPGGPGVIGIPPPEEAATGQVLTVHTDRKAKWKDATGGSGSGLTGYTVNNGSELKTFDVTDVSLDELARVVGQIIDDLQP